MATPLLETKLRIPPARPQEQVVLRSRLIDRLNENIRAGAKVILVSAPAGFGKTTLLSQWVHSTRSAPNPQFPALTFAWVSLDEDDSDPVRFWRYAIAALQTAQVNIDATYLEALDGDQLPPTLLVGGESSWTQPLLTSLINELAKWTASLVFILDDVHIIHDQRIHRSLERLVNALPPHTHLVLGTRSDPPWSLARLRARGELAELRATDLRFTTDETISMLNGVNKLDLSPEDVATLDMCTEGWVAGIKLAALSMQGHNDKSAFISGLSGTNRFILDYLVEEVLDRQPHSIRNFMMQTSILKQMGSHLCNTLTGRKDSQVVLRQMEEKNLFVVPLDDKRHSFRYHHLFRDLLLSRLQLTYPDQIPILHQRASRWYRQRGLISEAVYHALAAGDTHQLADIVEGNALAMMDRGNLGTLSRWLNLVPDEVRRSYPWLCVARAWALAYTGPFDAIQQAIQDAETALDTCKSTDAEHIRGHILTVQGYTTALQGGISPTIDLARQALECLPERDLRTRGVAAAVLGGALKENGDLAAAARALDRAIGIAQMADNSHVLVTNLCDLVRLQILQGKLHTAHATCLRAQELADRAAADSGWLLPVTGHVYTHTSRLLCEWNELEAATRLARQGLDLCQDWGWAELVVHGGLALSRALRAAGDLAGAEDAIQTAQQAARRVSPQFVDLLSAHKALLDLAQGDVHAASRWARLNGTEAMDGAPFHKRLQCLTLSRVLSAQGRLDEALTLLEPLLETTERAGAVEYVIQIHCLQAAILDAQGRPDQALAALERALELAQSEGYVRTFVDPGEPMDVLLRRAAARGIQVDYVQTLLDALAYKAPVHSLSPTPIEPLSERELEVVRLLVVGLSNKDIADTLVIAVGTVKQHLKSIYGKLAVHNRTEAAHRSRELGLV